MRVVIAAVVAAAACGGHPPIPNRGVVEGDLGAWHFRRFQGPIADVEVSVEGNKATAYSASYITEDAEKRGKIDDQDLCNVLVTRFEKADGVVRETVKLARRLAAESGYQVDEGKFGGGRALTITGNNESWVMWPSKQHVVKVGGRGRKDVPESMVSSYVDRYPSDLPGGALEGPLPGGPDAPVKGEPKAAYDSKNPTPDFEKMDPTKIKTKTDKKPVDDAPADDPPKKKKLKKDEPAADDDAVKKKTDDDPPPAKKKKKKKKPASDDE